jgi:ribonucleases P/MRP protein subunit RPP40
MVLASPQLSLLWPQLPPNTLLLQEFNLSPFLPETLSSEISVPEQHGFLPGKSCTTQMVGFADSLASSINDAARTDVVYFDFAKAFDSVSHDVLLYKLKTQFGIDGTLLKFIKNYLEGRKQRVVIGGLESGLRTVNSGVPQGSILGPLLFVLFINDMHKSVSPGTNIALYADDTKIWRKIVSYMDHIILQRDISALLEWSRINKMTFHPDKCKVVKVTLQVERYMDKFPYFLGEKCLDYADVEKDLGVKLVPRLCWNEHCQSLISSARSRLGLTKRTCHFIKNRRQRLIMYKTMVRSLFQHCAEIWRPSTKVALSKFEAVQKSARP